MKGFRRQALFLICFSFLIVLSLGEAVWASVPVKTSESVSEKEKTMSLEQLWEGVKGLLPSLWGEDEAGKGPKEPIKGDASPKITRQAETFSKKVEKKEEPYKVYAAPQVGKEGSDLITSAPKEPLQTDPLDQPSSQGGEEAPTEREEEVSPFIRRAEQTESPAVVSQYFPVLPYGAGEGAMPFLLPVASNQDLGGGHAAVSRAIIYIHDLSRNASDGVTMLTTLAGSDNGTTLILAPQFLLPSDIARFSGHLPEQGKLLARWPLQSEADGSGTWQTGGQSSSMPGRRGVSSFTAVDFLLLYLSDKHIFPTLNKIVIVGHGMGGDFVQRYAAVGKAPDLLISQNIPVLFVVSNPSSYLYLTAPRLTSDGAHFGLPDKSACPSYNAYPYGLEGLNAYARRNGVYAIRQRYASRNVMTFLSDQIKIDTFLDVSCPALAQGKDRYDRGRNFARYLAVSFGDQEGAEAHRFVAIPGAAYDPVTVFGSYCGEIALFGNGECGAKKRSEMTK